jgi:TRAP transporter TAXI family solute receptor
MTRTGHRIGTIAIVGLAALASLAAGGCASLEPKTIASGAAGGVYYPLAGAIARIAEKDAGLKLAVQATGGSVANAELLRNEQVQLALIQNDIAYYALTGTGLKGFDGNAVPDLRAITSIYPEYIQIVATNASGVGSVSELRGKRVGLGLAGSGTEQNALQVLGAYGIRQTDLGAAVRQDTLPTLEALKSGALDAAFFTVGAGQAGIGDALASGRAHLVPVPVNDIERLRLVSSLYWRDEVPAGTYPGQSAAVSTPSLRVLLVTLEGVPEEAVYRLTRGIFENLNVLRDAHPAARDLTLEQALRVVSVPLHPGALRYFREKGIQQ